MTFLFPKCSFVYIETQNKSIKAIFLPKSLAYSKKVAIFAFESTRLMNDVEDFLSYLLTDKGYSDETIRDYREALLSVEAFYQALDEQITWQTLHHDVVRQWMASRMEKGISARTMCKCLSALRTFYKYMLRMGRVLKNPVRLIPNPKCHAALPTFLKNSEVNRLFDEVPFSEDFSGRRDYTILLTFYHTGIRLSELVGLNVEDINLAGRELKVTGKRNKQRIIPFGNELAAALQKYLEARYDLLGVRIGMLFVTVKGERINRSQVQSLVRKNLSLVTTQKKKSPHVLRHTYATAMLNNGADLEAIKELLGHESVATTEVYTHTTFADLKKQYKLAHPRA